MYTTCLARAATATFASTGIVNTTRSTRAAALRPATAHVRAAKAHTFGNTNALRQTSLAVKLPVARKMSLQTTAAESKGKALVSVFDKTGLPELAKGLSELGYEVVSTGGSAKAVAAAGIPVTQVDEITGFPEMLGGRVKTLHPVVHGGILAKRGDAEHMETLKEHKIGTIDLVVGNLYPFKQTVASGAAFPDCVEQIDIGGPTMLRAAAKNHADVLVVVDPADYPLALEVLAGKMPEEEVAALRKRLAWKAYQHTASYDSQVAEWLWNAGGVGNGEFPPEMSVPMTLANTCRYGENSHQAAAVYMDQSLAEMGGTGVAAATLHHGKEMSYNNYLDTEAAYSAVCDFDAPTCVIVKHTNPCGVASAASDSSEDLLEAYRLAVRADPISAFGGIVAFNRPVTEELAAELREFRSPTDDETRMFYEIVVAPAYTEAGLAKLKGKSKTLRILEAAPRVSGSRQLRQVGGGWLYQDVDALKPAEIEFAVASEKQPTEQEMKDIKFAWSCVKHVKSNAITIAKGNRMLGMGSGQPNRVKSVEIALEKAGEEVKGSVMASDAFFPFAWGDSVEKACQAGVAAIVHPGGSMRDQDAVDCCNKYGVALLTTGVRHFRH
uniref:MGS-like domain-containing protein n=1 Tax=Pyramimonas obovata TaxID=1411642 RepID=A0A7S0WK32_9CHLO|mmetsp:Transcript_28192/g.61787  ORF Transcript_28192/g.61787 Transcript_28192/m.61787 type:complete len:610 (+) Transcript_28192:334-2163(+)